MNKSSGKPEYRQRYAEQARKLRHAALTDREIAEFFGADEQTLHEWQALHPQFNEALRGRLAARRQSR